MDSFLTPYGLSNSGQEKLKFTPFWGPFVINNPIPFIINNTVPAGTAIPRTFKGFWKVY